jgi:hypothetical protein
MRSGRTVDRRFGISQHKAGLDCAASFASVRSGRLAGATGASAARRCGSAGAGAPQVPQAKRLSFQRPHFCTNSNRDLKVTLQTEVHLFAAAMQPETVNPVTAAVGGKHSLFGDSTDAFQQHAWG